MIATCWVRWDGVATIAAWPGRLQTAVDPAFSQSAVDPALAVGANTMAAAAAPVRRSGGRILVSMAGLSVREVAE